MANPEFTTRGEAALLLQSLADDAQEILGRLPEEIAALVPPDCAAAVAEAIRGTLAEPLSAMQERAEAIKKGGA